MLTFGSLFAGIGGMDLGLERAGMVCRWQVEIDDYCRRVLTKHWPDVPKYGDIREVAGGELEAVDLICGGFPCQDISSAGERAGIAGKQSGLWSEYLRIVRVLRPRFVLVENVSALLWGDIGVVLGDLAASGYDTEWDCIPAAAVGAPHRRDRVFIVAYTNRDREQQPQGAFPQQRRRFGDSSQTQDLADTECDRWQQSPQVFRGRQSVFAPSGEGRGGWWRAEPDVGRVAHGVPGRVDRLRGLGNAVVPQVAEWIGRRILEAA